MTATAALGHVLVVDDEIEMCELVQAALAPHGYRVSACTSGEAAIARIEAGGVDVLLSDNQMGGMTGIELCQAALAKQPGLSVIIFTGFGSMEVAVEALRAGAYDFVTKPVSLEVLVLTVQRAARHRKLKLELARLEAPGAPAPAPAPIVAMSAAMRHVLDVVKRVAQSETTVLVIGETGTGKEVVARALHDASGRSGPFLAVNCAAFPEQLLESELFGHLPGSFTDARTARAGVFLDANHGTLFLDEIGEMPLGMQAKLLRALQERVVRPLGGSKEVRFDTRIVAATNRDLEAEVALKRFREDLFYRINVVSVEVPPLRLRMEEVLPLAHHFVQRAASRSGQPRLRIGRRVAARLLDYDWPGNVRELENCIERAIAFARYDEITVDDLPAEIRGEVPIHVLDASGIEAGLPQMQLVEERYIRKVLEAMGGNKTAAAKVLGIDLRTLYRKLARLEQDSEADA